MAWLALSAEISQMFGELDGRLEHDRGLEIVTAIKRAKAVERTRLWRVMNPERSREINRRAQKKWRKQNPEKYRAQRKRADARYIARNRERMRAIWRANTAKYRAKKRRGKNAGKGT